MAALDRETSEWVTPTQQRPKRKRMVWLGSVLIGCMLVLLSAGWLGGTPSFLAEAIAQEQGQVPGASRGSQSDSDFWRAIRQGDAGQVSGPNPQAGVMIQSEGDLWRSMRNGPLSTYGVWVLVGVVAALALLFLLRGRIKIDAGESGYRLVRFNGFERAVHWLTASTFIVLAITGLNLLYGRYFMPYLVGPDIFAWLTLAGKYAHNYLAFGFMIGIALMFVLWLIDNIPNHHDLVWLLKGGGVLMKGVHPPAKKFNAGQKILFWLVILGGTSLSLSGLASDVSLPVFDVRRHVREDQRMVRHRLADHAHADPGAAVLAALACRRRHCHDRDHHRPYLYRHHRYGRRLRCDGRWRGGLQLGARAP